MIVALLVMECYKRILEGMFYFYVKKEGCLDLIDDSASIHNVEVLSMDNHNGVSLMEGEMDSE